jgi:hypothetical protein
MKAVDSIISMCVMHNFLLTRNDTWTPTVEDIELLDELEDDFYESIIHSPWAHVMSAHGERGSGAEARQGNLKRDRIMAHIVQTYGQN